MGGMGLIFFPLLVRCLLGPPSFSEPMTSTFGLIDALNSLIGRYSPPLAIHPPLAPTTPSPTYLPPLYFQSMIL